MITLNFSAMSLVFPSVSYTHLDVYKRQVEVYFLEPAVQLAGGNAAVSGFDYAIDHGVEAVDMLTGFCGEKDYRGVGEKF